MTNPLNGEPLKMPSRASAAEHLITIPMAFAVAGSLCGWIALAGFFAPDSPWFKLLMSLASGLPPLAVQLGQMWHSRNVRNKIAVANGAAPKPAEETNGQG